MFVDQFSETPNKIWVRVKVEQQQFTLIFLQYYEFFFCKIRKRKKCIFYVYYLPSLFLVHVNNIDMMRKTLVYIKLLIKLFCYLLYPTNHFLISDKTNIFIQRSELYDVRLKVDIQELSGKKDYTLIYGGFFVVLLLTRNSNVKCLLKRN